MGLCSRYIALGPSGRALLCVTSMGRSGTAIASNDTTAPTTTATASNARKHPLTTTSPRQGVRYPQQPLGVVVDPGVRSCEASRDAAYGVRLLLPDRPESTSVCSSPGVDALGRSQAPMSYSSGRG